MTSPKPVPTAPTSDPTPDGGKPMPADPSPDGGKPMPADPPTS